MCSCIPVERWPLILMSLFAFHNQTRQFRLRAVLGLKLLNSGMPSQHSHPSDSVRHVVSIFYIRHQFWNSGGQWPRGCIYCFYPHLSV
jgi:hypothetical protein